MTDFREWGKKVPPDSWAAPKKPILNKVKLSPWLIWLGRVEISSTRKLSAWSCPLNHNLPEHVLHFFVSTIMNSYSTSKEMFQFSTYIIPLDEISYHKHTQIMKAQWRCKSFCYNTILLLKKSLKLLSNLFHFFTKW